MNKTRAQFRTLLKTIPFSVDDVEKIPNISAKVKSMLLVHPDVISEREAPYCFLSQIEDAYAELTLGCTLKNKVSNLFNTNSFLSEVFRSSLPSLHNVG